MNVPVPAGATMAPAPAPLSRIEGDVPERAIPIRNIYYLLCYAWKHWREGAPLARGAEDFTRTTDLLAHVLCEGIAQLIRRGMDRSYVLVQEDVPGVRGAIDISNTVKRALKPRARTHCRFDELSHDVLHNRILKATLRRLCRVEELQSSLRHRARDLHARLESVSDVTILRRDFGRVQVHRNNRVYSFLRHICLLIHDHSLIDETTGKAQVRDFREDERTMWQIFETFAANFFDREQAAFRVLPQRKLDWFEKEGRETDLRYLPAMKPDIVLEAPARRIILDTKYSREALKAGRGGVERARSGHLYQIFSYVENRQADRPDGPPHEGMLVYPVVTEPFRLDYRLKGHRIQIRGITLDQPWEEIHRDMLALLDLPA